MRVLVTGGAGFLGSAIIRMLADQGHTPRNFSRGDYPELHESAIETYRGDIKDIESLRHAANGCDAVIHTAAKAGVWGDREEYFQINVQGTHNVIAVCRELKIRRLIYTSSPSVVFSGQDEIGIDESAPYAQNFLTDYPHSKALAERAVLAANDQKLSTIALRPHLIWGPGDPHLIPRVLERARSNKLALLGDGTNQVDSTYVDNAAHAHLLALTKLSPTASCAGQAYFISNGEPISMKQLLNNILRAAQMPPVTRHIHPQLAYALGAALESVYRCLSIKNEPVMSRFVARQLSTHHWFNLDKARQDLGYVPLIQLEDGFERLGLFLGGSSQTE